MTKSLPKGALMRTYASCPARFNLGLQRHVPNSHPGPPWPCDIAVVSTKTRFSLGKFGSRGRRQSRRRERRWCAHRPWWTSSHPLHPEHHSPHGFVGLPAVKRIEVRVGRSYDSKATAEPLLDAGGHQPPLVGITLWNPVAERPAQQ